MFFINYSHIYSIAIIFNQFCLVPSPAHHCIKLVVLPVQIR